MRTASLPHGVRARVLLAAATCLLPLLLALPGRFALGVAAACALAAVLSWRGHAPAWLKLALVLLLGTGAMAAMGWRFGRDTGCALLATMLALKPLELRAPRDARSLLGFALFAPFATFLLDQGPLSLALGLAGAIAALAAMQRLSEHESHDPHPQPATRHIRDVLRLVAAGLPLALAAFWLFPRLPAPLWGVPERALSQPGLSDSMEPGGWIDLMVDDTPALRVTFAGEAPPPSRMYWRGPVLTDYDGRRWTVSRLAVHAPPPAVEPGDTVWDYELEVEPTDDRILVALELPHAAPAGATLTHDYDLRAQRPLTSVTRWRIRASPPRRFEAELPPQVRAATLRLPEGFNPRTVALGRKWREEAGEGNDAAIVARALAMIREEFAYTLATPLPGRHAADEFLFEWKQGYCEHFSSAFVVLMRAAGIPARVVTGYAGGYRNPYGGYWVVRRMDAHAWAEVWLEGRGWVRVDPTAAVAPERIYDTLEDRVGTGLRAFPVIRPALDIGDWLRRGWNDLVLGWNAARQRDLFRPAFGGRAGTRALVAAFALAAVLALAWMAWLAARGAREHDPVLRAWHRMGRRYARLGLGREPHEPALRWAERISPALPEACARELRALSLRFAHWRYASGRRDAAAMRALVRDLRGHRPRTGDPREPTP